MTAPRNFVNLDTDAYLADTGHLSTLEHGAYLLILMAMRRSKDGWIDGSDHFLARATRMTLGRWKRIAPTIRALLIGKEGRVTQKRVQRDRRVSTPESIPGGNQNLNANPLKNRQTDSRPAESPSLTLTSDSEIQRKVKKERGAFLSESWVPGDAERLYGRTVLRMTDAEVDAAAEKMRRWALANRHRAVARKSNWDLTFRNWLDGDAERRSTRGVGNGREDRSASAASGRIAERLASGELAVVPRPTAPSLLPRSGEVHVRQLPEGRRERS